MKKPKKQARPKFASTKLDDCELQTIRGGDRTLGKVVMDSDMLPT